MRVRAANPLDAGAAGAILAGFVDETAWMPQLYSHAETISFAGSMIDKGWVQVVEDDGRVAGFLARDDTFVHALYVAGAARRKGFGHALLKEAQRQVNHLHLWTFVANTSAQAFYAAHGFREVQRTDGTRNEEGLPDIEMVWDKEAG